MIKQLIDRSSEHADAKTIHLQNCLLPTVQFASGCAILSRHLILPVSLSEGCGMYGPSVFQPHSPLDGAFRPH